MYGVRSHLAQWLNSDETISLVLLQAESKAEDAAARLEELLQKATKNWLPLWLEEHYNKVRSHLKSSLILFFECKPNKGRKVCISLCIRYVFVV